MRFSVTGLKNDKIRIVQWEDGKLTGNPELVKAIEDDATKRAEEPVGPMGGPYTVGYHLGDPLSAAILIGEAFDEITSTDGEVPVPPEVPEGAVV